MHGCQGLHKQAEKEFEERLKRLRLQNEHIIGETAQVKAKFRHTLELLHSYQSEHATVCAGQATPRPVERCNTDDLVHGEPNHWHVCPLPV